MTFTPSASASPSSASTTSEASAASSASVKVPGLLLSFPLLLPESILGSPDDAISVFDNNLLVVPQVSVVENLLLTFVNFLDLLPFGLFLDLLPLGLYFIVLEGSLGCVKILDDADVVPGGSRRPPVGRPHKLLLGETVSVPSSEVTRLVL